MSAFLVNNKHINAIVTYAVKSSIILDEEAQAVGEQLLRANLYSLKVRYDDKLKVSELGYKFVSVVVSDIQVYKCIECLNYQSCEYKYWSRSTSYKLLESLKTSISAIYGDVNKHPHYDNLSWELS